MKRLSEENEDRIKELQSELFEQYPEAHSFTININQDYIEIEVGELNGDVITIQSPMEKTQ